jgi:hypothetical protein
MKIAELLNVVTAGHRKIETALAVLSQGKMETPLTNDGWTVKETLVHLTFWEQKLLEDYTLWKRGETPIEFQGQEGMDAVNAATLKKAKTMPLPVVLEDFKVTFQKLLNWLEALDSKDLDKPFMYGMSLGEFIAEDTWKHYEEHLPLLLSKRTD